MLFECIEICSVVFKWFCYKNGDEPLRWTGNTCSGRINLSQISSFKQSTLNELGWYL